MRLTFVPIHVFRETPAVTFFDARSRGVMALMLLPIMVLQSRRPMMSKVSNIMFINTRLITTWS